MPSTIDSTPTAPATLAAAPPIPKVEQTATSTKAHKEVDKKEMTTEPNADTTADAKSDELRKDTAGATATTTVANIKVDEKTVDEAKEVEFLKGDTPMEDQEEPATKETPTEEDATVAPVVKTTTKSTLAEDVELPKDDISKVEPAKAEATTKEVPNKEGALVATVAGEKRSASDAADADEKKDGSPPQEVVESLSGEQPATELVDAVEDLPCAQSVSEVKNETTTAKSTLAEEVAPPKEDASEENPTKEEAVTKKAPEKEGDLAAIVAGKKRSAIDAAVADMKNDGSPPQKVAIGKFVGLPVTEVVGVAEGKKEDPTSAHPISEDKIKKMVGTPIKV